MQAEAKILEYVERKREERIRCLQKPERYRKSNELEKIEATLVTLETLAIECGLIAEWTT